MKSNDKFQVIAMKQIHPKSDRLDQNLRRVFAEIWQELHLTHTAEAPPLTPLAVSHAMA